MRVKHFFKLLTLLLVCTFVSANIQHIDAQALLTLIQQQKAPLILDVRSQQEYQQGHIKGAINIPYDQLKSNSELLNSQQNSEIIIYCRSGARAEKAYKTLHSKGFTQLIYLKGHMNLWQQFHYPLIKSYSTLLTAF